MESSVSVDTLAFCKTAMLTDYYVHAYVCMRKRTSECVNNVCARLCARGRAMLARKDKYKV